jgi:hypothetical protein
LCLHDAFLHSVSFDVRTLQKLILDVEH